MSHCLRCKERLELGNGGARARFLAAPGCWSSFQTRPRMTRLGRKNQRIKGLKDNDLGWIEGCAVVADTTCVYSRPAGRRAREKEREMWREEKQVAKRARWCIGQWVGAACSSADPHDQNVEIA